MKFASTEPAKLYSHPEKDKVIRYIELMNSKSSELNKIENIEERKKTACEQAGLKMAPEDEGYKKLVVYYLNYFQHNNKYSLLRTREEMLIEALVSLSEPLLPSKDEDKRLKNVKLKGDLDLLCERLVNGIESLYKEIYAELSEVAKEEMRVSLSPEQRLKNKK